MTSSRLDDDHRVGQSGPLGLFNHAIQAGAIATLAFAMYRLAPEVQTNGANLALALIVLTVVGAAGRRFVIPVFGRTEASGVWTVIWVTLFVRDWPLAVVTAAASTFIGDALLRHLRLARVFDGTTRMIAGAGVAGLAFSELGGEIGSNLLAPENLPAVTAALLSLPVATYALSYLNRQRGVVTWGGGAAYLAFRWEMIVGFVAAGLAVGWAKAAATSLPAAPAAFWGTALLTTTVLLYRVVTKAVRNEERRWVEELLQSLGAELNIAHGFDRILDTTRRLVPCEHMAFYSYNPTTEQLEIIADSESNRATDLSVHEGLVGSAVRLGRPVIHTGEIDTSPSGNLEARGSELLIPLFHGHELVGLWSVRHSERNVYGSEDASLLALMSPPLILSLSVSQLLRPIAVSSHHAAQSLRKVEATRHTLHGVARQVEDASGRALEGVQLASDKISAALETLSRLVEGIDEVAQSATESTRTSRSMSIETDNLKAATAKTAAQLTRLEDTIRLGATEIERLKEAATEVEGFSQAISAISNQTNLLALNATIESARAGAHGRGFRVVAEKVRDLADQSARAAQNINRSARKTRKAIDGSTHVMDDINTQLHELTEASAHWALQLREITTVAEVTRATGEQLARMPIANRSVADEARQILDDANRAAAASTEAARIVAESTNAQVTNLVDLARGTAELSDLAKRLDKGLQLLGGGASTNGAER